MYWNSGVREQCKTTIFHILIKELGVEGDGYTYQPQKD